MTALVYYCSSSAVVLPISRAAHYIALVQSAQRPTNAFIGSPGPERAALMPKLRGVGFNKYVISLQQPLSER